MRKAGPYGRRPRKEKKHDRLESRGKRGLKLSAAIPAHRALGFECITIPNALTATAPMSVRLLFSQLKLAGEWSDPEFLQMWG